MPLYTVKNKLDYSANHQAIAEAWLSTVGKGSRLSPPKIRATAEAVHHLIVGDCYEKLREIQLPFIKGQLRDQLETLSVKLQKAGKARENRYVLELLVGSDPEDHKHRRFLGETMESIKGKGNDESLSLYFEAHELNPRFPQYLANLGRCWLARREPNRFIEHLSKLPDDVRIIVMNDHCNAILSDCLRQNGDPAAASKLRRSMIDSGSRNAAFYNDEAKYLIESNQPQQALTLLDKAVKLGIANDYTQSVRATAIAKSGDAAAASKLRRSMIDSGSRDAAFYNDEAKYLTESNQPQQALALLDKGVKLGIANDYTQSVRATAIAKSGDAAAASKLRRSMIDSGSRNAVFYNDEAKYLIESNQPQQALTLLDKAVKLGIADDYIQSVRATAIAKSGDPVAASKLRRSMIDSGSRNAVFYNDEAKYLIESNQPQQALTLLDKVVKLGIADDYTQSVRATAIAASARRPSVGKSGAQKPVAIAVDSSELQEAKRQIRELIERRQFSEAIAALDDVGVRGFIDREILELRRKAAAEQKPRDG